MKKLLDFIKKLLGGSSSSSSESGFTLIELLVVIAIIGVLLVGSIVAINPVQKINAAKDATGKSAVDQVAQAMQSYYTQNQRYPAIVSDLVGTNNELRSEPKSSGGNSFTVVKNPVGCSTTGGTACTDVSVYFTLNYQTAAGQVWCWRSAIGTASAVPTSANCTAP